MQQLRASSEEKAKEQLKLFFITDKIAEKLGVTTTEEEINGHIAQVAASGNRRPEKVREELVRNGSLAEFSLQVREQKCIEKLLESAKITEVKAKSEKKAEKKAAEKKDEKEPAKKAAKKETDKAEKKAEAKKTPTRTKKLPGKTDKKSDKK
jgi:trigger factor